MRVGDREAFSILAKWSEALTLKTFGCERSFRMKTLPTALPSPSVTLLSARVTAPATASQTNLFDAPLRAVTTPQVSPPDYSTDSVAHSAVSRTRDHNPITALPFAPGNIELLRYQATFLPDDASERNASVGPSDFEPLLVQLLGRGKPNIARYSLSALETYQESPAQFFDRVLLGLQEERATLRQSLAIVTGQLIHSTLQKFYNAHLGSPFSASDFQCELFDTAASEFRASEYPWDENEILKQEKLRILSGLKCSENYSDKGIASSEGQAERFGPLKMALWIHEHLLSDVSVIGTELAFGRHNSALGVPTIQGRASHNSAQRKNRPN